MNILNLEYALFYGLFWLAFHPVAFALMRNLLQGLLSGGHPTF